MIAKLSLPPWPDAAAPIVEGAKEEGAAKRQLGHACRGGTNVNVDMQQGSCRDPPR